MKIKGLPRAQPDETFSSWVWRCGIHPRCGRINEKDAHRIFDSFREVDPDYDFEAAGLLSICEKARITPKLAERYFAPRCSLVNPVSYRGYYCRKCIRDNVENGLLPVWRKKWAYYFYACCEEHRELLIPLHRYKNHDVEKGWSAFALSKVANRALFSYRAFDKVDCRFFKPVGPLHKVQRWFNELERNQVHTINKGMLETCAHPILPLAQLMLKIFLTSRTSRHNSGPARYWMSGGSDEIQHELFEYGECMEHGLMSAVPYYRMIALLWVGQLFEVLNDGDIAFLKKHSMDTGFLRWIDDLYDLGFETADLLDESRYVHVVMLLQDAGAMQYSSFQKFLHGLEHAAIQRRFLFGPLRYPPRTEDRDYGVLVSGMIC